MKGRCDIYGYAFSECRQEGIRGGNKKAGKYLDIWEKGCNFAPTFRKMCDCEQEVELKFKNKKA
ncbi:MAG: hypothetical protein IJ698_04715 [Prevotella sp.]|nr:hypothetical protein [Prevotella sp.]